MAYTRNYYKFDRLTYYASDTCQTLPHLAAYPNLPYRNHAIPKVPKRQQLSEPNIYNTIYAISFFNTFQFTQIPL